LEKRFEHSRKGTSISFSSWEIIWPL
jgi:hypothetical protein